MIGKKALIRQLHARTLLTVLAATLGLGMIVAWVWLQQALIWLPDPRSQEGKDLLYAYNRISHQIALALLALAVLMLLWNGLRSGSEASIVETSETRSSPSQPWWRQLAHFAREHPLVLVI